jgi:GH15 family glucan-1,4-alpha-glucosidase
LLPQALASSEAQKVFQRVISTGNDLLLLTEEYDTQAGEMLGNFPQGLAQLSLITAAVALAEMEDGAP